MLTKKILLAILTYLLLTITAFSQRLDPWQNPEFGADSISRVECAHNLSTLSEFMKINLPDYALPSWRKVFESCPQSSKNIYILGARIFSSKIEEAKQAELKNSYIDTLMMLYDKRIEYFGEEGIVLGRKAMDLIKYGGEEAFENAYPIFKQSVKSAHFESEPNALIGLSETSFAMYKATKITVNEFLENYIFLSEILENQMNNTRMRNRANLAHERVEANLADAGINNCEDIEKVFRARFDKSPEDEKTLSLISTLLKNAGCENGTFFRDVYFEMFKKNPTSDLAVELSKHYLKNDDFENAIVYIIKSFELESDVERKSQYALQTSIIYYSKLEKYKEAAEYALIAIDLNPGWAEPYFTLTPAYIEGIKQCTNESFERMTVFWLATDLMVQASRVDPSVTTKANTQINEYKRFYPSKEEAFFRSLKDGSPYSIGCWINRSTTVKMN